MRHFRVDNTEGYGPKHLAIMNQIADERITDEMDYEEIQCEKESIQMLFDEVRMVQIRDYLTERDLRKHDKQTADRLRKMGYARL